MNIVCLLIYLGVISFSTFCNFQHTDLIHILLSLYTAINSPWSVYKWYYVFNFAFYLPIDVHKNVIEFLCVLTLYPEMSLKSVIISGWIFCLFVYLDFLGFFFGGCKQSCHLQIGTLLHLFFLICMPSVSFYCLIAVARTSSTMLKRVIKVCVLACFSILGAMSSTSNYNLRKRVFGRLSSSS